LLPSHVNPLSAFYSILFSTLTAPPVEFATSAILTFATLVWLGSYQLGLFLNLRYSKITRSKKILLHLKTLVLCPVLGLIETFPAFWATIEYSVRKRQISETVNVYDFYVINK
jgi:egghead protein (zeste-white 4 protein)